MVVATVHCRPMAKDEGIVRPCATAPRPTAWRPTGRFSRAPCAPWQKEIRCVPQRGSCWWTQTPRWVSLAADPLGLPHQRGHEPLPTPKPTRDTGSLRTWRPCDSGDGDGIADHVWATRAWPSYRVSAACLHQWHAIEYLSPH